MNPPIINRIRKNVNLWSDKDNVPNEITKFETASPMKTIAMISCLCYDQQEKIEYQSHKEKHVTH